MFGKSEIKTEKEPMTREQAFIKIEEWVKKTRAKAYGDSLLELQNIIWVAVVDERLNLDENVKRKFIYVLEEPIKSASDQNEIMLSMVYITPQKMKKVFEMEKEKSTDGKTYKMIESYCTDSNGEDIPVGRIMNLDPRDSVVIQAVISAFFF